MMTDVVDKMNLRGELRKAYYKGYVAAYKIFASDYNPTNPYEPNTEEHIWFENGLATHIATFIFVAAHSTGCEEMFVNAALDQLSKDTGIPLATNHR